MGRLRDDNLRLTPSPAWEQTPPVTTATIERAFVHATPFTIGVEEELMLVDPVSLELAPRIDEALALIGPDDRFVHELRSAQLEIVTPICATAVDACRELEHARRDLVERLDGRLRILAAGTHPFSNEHGSITEEERYRQIADEYRWAATRSLVCGLHVHVAVAGADTALAVHNALRSYLPELAAVAANSAFFEGRDTGLSSIRPKLNEGYPRSGIPPAFASWDDLVRYVDWGRRGGLFPDFSHFWWDLRPHLAHGTIEVRVCDTQTASADGAAIVALIHSLVAWLADRHDGGDRLPVHETHFIVENSWRAHRYGVRGWLVDLDTGQRVPTRERLADLMDSLEPYAARSGAAEHLAAARTLLAGNGSDRQRYVAEREGLRGLTTWLVERTEEPARGE